MRCRWIVVAAALGLVLGGGLPQGPAIAATCSEFNHCYGIAEWSTSAVHGIAESLTVSCLQLSNTTSNFVTEEMWLATDGSTGNYWVEAGMAYGYPKGATRYWFWADKRPGTGGYHEHDLTISANLNTTYGNDITWAGNNSWQITRNGTLLGTSTSNPGPSIYEQAGEEMIDDAAQAAATHDNLTYQDTSGNWHSGWSGAGIYQDQPPYAAWTNAYHDMEAYSNCSFATPTPMPTNAPITSDAAAALKRIAFDLARHNGQAHPRSIAYVATTRQEAIRLVTNGQDIVDTNQPVYLVSMQGPFQGAEAKVPTGHTQPRGNVMTATVDPASGAIVDWSIQNSNPDLNQLGRVIRFG
jgi:hypothetical protein